MNAPPPSPPFAPAFAPTSAPQVARHVCFSGSLSCSGVEPCDACSQQLKEFVFKRALEHALRAEQAALIDELHAASQQMRPLNLQHLTNVAYANFFAALAACYQQVHQQIDQDMQRPPEQRAFAARNMTAIMQAAESYQTVLRERERSAASANVTAPRNGGVVLGSVMNVAPRVPANVAAPQVTPAAPSPYPAATQVFPAHVVVDPIPQHAPAPPPPIVVAPVDFDRAMQMAEAQMPPRPEPPSDANGSGSPDKSRRLTADDFALAAETHDENGGQPPGTSSSS